MSNLFKGGLTKFLLMTLNMFQVNFKTEKLKIRSEIHIQVWSLTQRNY